MIVRDALVVVSVSDEPGSRVKDGREGGGKPDVHTRTGSVREYYKEVAR